MVTIRRPFHVVMFLLTSLAGLIPAMPGVAISATIDFEELTKFTASGGTGDYFNGNADGSSSDSGWSSNGVHFGNSYSTDFGGIWSGWSYSNVRDAVTEGFGNQYAAFPGAGYEDSANYAVGFAGESLFLNLPAAERVESVQVTNTTYAALSMLNGDLFAKKFGGDTGNDADFLSVTFTGYADVGAQGDITGSQQFFLADYRFADNSLDYVVDSWERLDLTALGEARSVGLSFESSDMGAFGINTPTFVAIDQLTTLSVPEPGCPGMLAALGLVALLCRGAPLRFRRDGHLPRA